MIIILENENDRIALSELCTFISFEREKKVKFDKNYDIFKPIYEAFIVNHVLNNN